VGLKAQIASANLDANRDSWRPHIPEAFRARLRVRFGPIRAGNIPPGREGQAGDMARRGSVQFSRRLSAWPRPAGFVPHYAGEG